MLEWGAALGVPWPIIGMEYLEGRNMAGYTGNANKKVCLSFIHLWGSLNYPHVRDQTMQIYGTFEGIFLYYSELISDPCMNRDLLKPLIYIANLVEA